MRAAKTPHAKMVARKKPSMTLYLRLGGTRRTFHLTAVQPGDSIRDIKADIELVAGIPAHILRLSFLDEGDLHDDSTVNDNYIVTGATLDLRVWDHWQLLMTIASKGDSETIFNLGVTKTSSYKSSYTDYMNEVDRQDWFAQRGFVALFIACHRGHYGLAQRLINAGVDVNCATKLGRRPLHAAACQNNYKIVNLLLQNGELRV
ncbi:PREDICTED: ankyrin repeat domain-containing protein 60-like [Priapulus caudatus]|uniref:Ankyrin repeat domain-containing protein 60-like n=1 Tax=Priapulus caudatus TaxID=37621 RepID=A0ABM1EV81_PRICU|nr:PREDICTED: ankyrin repeat domain-containing protein 60-like [Priapulus caudatus]